MSFFPRSSSNYANAQAERATGLEDQLDDLLDEDELANQEIGFTSRDNILFCFDGSSHMQLPLPDDPSLCPASSSSNAHDPDEEEEEQTTEGKGKSVLHVALECVLGVMRGKVLSGPGDYVGLLVYNVDASRTPLPSSTHSSSQLPFTLNPTKNGNGYIIQFQLRQIGAEEIKRLNGMMEEANLDLASQPRSPPQGRGQGRAQPSIISETFPPVREGEEVDVAIALEGCLHAFRDAGAKLPGNKRIFLVTNNDRPERILPGSSKGGARYSTRGPARTRYMDLLSLGIEIDPFFVSMTEEAFNEDFYWNDILNREPSDSSQNPDSLIEDRANNPMPYDGLFKLQELMQDQVYRRSSKRVVFNLPMRLGGRVGEIVISVNGYSLISTMRKPTYRYYDMSGRQPVEVKTKTAYTAAATGDRLDNSQIGFAYNFGKSDANIDDLVPNPWKNDMDEYAPEEYEDGNSGSGGGTGDGVDDGDITEEEEEEEEVQPKKGKNGFGAGEQGYGGKSSGGGGKNDNGQGKKPSMGQVRTRIALTQSDIREYKTLGMDPQIKIIGFMNPDNVRFEYNIKNSVFIYPDEKTYSGSTRTFAALLASCVAKKKCALAFCISRRNSTPFYAALLPQAEKIGETGVQERPPGFHMITLPFMDDLRQRPDAIAKNMTLCHDAQAEAMSAVIHKLRMKQATYEPRAYPNPDLNYFFGKLQSLAFEEEFKPDQMDDLTQPLLAGMHHKGGKVLRAFNDLMREDERASRYNLVPNAQTKRKAAEDVGEMSLEYFRALWESGQLKKETVVNLKAFASQNGIAQNNDRMLKPHWIEIIQEWFDAAQAEDAKPALKKRKV